MILSEISIDLPSPRSRVKRNLFGTSVDRAELYSQIAQHAEEQRKELSKYQIIEEISVILKPSESFEVAEPIMPNEEPTTIQPVIPSEPKELKCKTVSKKKAQGIRLVRREPYATNKRQVQTTIKGRC